LRQPRFFQANSLWCNSPLVVPRTRNQVQLFLREFVEEAKVSELVVE
jgi:hypothetical protein